MLVAYGGLLARHGTAMFGLNVLNVFMVASATITGFFFGTLFGQLPDSFTSEQLEVVSYSVFGLFAMVAGIHVAWLPRLSERRTLAGAMLDDRLPAHLTEEMGWLTFCVGAVAELLYTAVYNVPTVSTAAHCLSTLARIGLCILLVTAIENRRWARFVLALAVFQILSVVSSLATGFSFIRFATLLPLAVIWLASAGGRSSRILRVCVLGPVCAAATFAASTAWLDTRRLIRGGFLAGLPVWEQAREFFTAYLENLTIPTADSIMRTIMLRVDMTVILAAQVLHQPAVEPYSYGRTMLSSFYTLIPRALWQDKPVVAGGSAFVSQFSGLQWDSATSVGLPYPFELYANGGRLWVIVGLAIIGYVGGRLELKLTRPQTSLGGFWALSLLTAVLTEGGQRMDVVFPALVASALAVYALGLCVESFGGEVMLRRSRNISADRGWRTRPSVHGRAISR